MRHLINRSGQTLLIAILLASLLLISIPVLVYLNQTGVVHLVGFQHRAKGRTIAEAGLAYATQQLSANFATWDAAVNNNNFHAGAPALDTDCNLPALINSPTGNGSFNFTCSRDPVANPNLQPYQVAVNILAYMPDGSANPRPIRKIRAYLGQRTLGVDLAFGLHSGAALQLMRRPALTGNNQLVVHWGPIVCFDTGDGVNAWAMFDPLDHFSNGTADFPGFPRKFTQGGLTGNWPTAALPTYARSPTATDDTIMTDQKEYWAFASQVLPPLVDEENFYKNRAKFNSPIVTPPDCGGVPCPTHPDCGGNPCGYFQPGAAVAVFNNTFAAPNDAVIYVEGNAQLDATNIELNNGGAFIVTGALTLGPNAGGGSLRRMRVPRSAEAEYFYWNQAVGTTWPGKADVGTLTLYDSGSPLSPFPVSGGLIQFRGFLHSKGDLHVTDDWNIIGSVLVGNMQVPIGGITGQLVVDPGKTLTLAYDEEINHRIRVNPVAGAAIRVVPEFQVDLPTP